MFLLAFFVSYFYHFLKDSKTRNNYREIKRKLNVLPSLAYMKKKSLGFFLSFILFLGCIFLRFFFVLVTNFQWACCLHFFS